MKGVILHNPYYYNDSVKAQAGRIARELTRLGAESEIHPNSGVTYLCENSPPDFVVFLDKDKYAPRLLERRGVRV